MNPTTTQPNPSAPVNFDPQVVALSKAIIQHESAGNFSAKGASGEYGAGQWMPDTWNAQASKVLGYVPKFGTAEMTPDVQKAVIASTLTEDKNAGLNPAQIAAKWNSGSPVGWENKIGTNDQGVPYNVPQYVKSVTDLYQQYKTQTPTLPDAGTTATPSPYTGFLGTKPQDSLYGKIIDNSITRGIENFFPGKQIGNYIGTGLGYAASGFSPYYDTSHPSLAQVGADAIQAGLTIAMPGAGEGAGVVGRIGAQAITGAGFSAAGAVANGETDPSKILDAAGQGSVIGGVAGTAGELLAAGANKIADPLAKAATSDVAGASERLGVKTSELPLSSVTNSKTVKYAESLFNGPTIANQVEKLQSKLDTITQEAVAGTGVAEDLSTAGQHIAKGLSNFENTYNKETARLYDTFGKEGGNLPVQSFNAIDMLNHILDQKQVIGESADAGYFKNKLEVLTAGEGHSMPTFDTIKQLRTAVGEKIGTKFQDPFVKQNIGQLKQLYGALSQDMTETIAKTGNKSLVKSLKAANDAYIKGRALMNTEYAKTIRRFAANGQYDKIIPAITAPSKSMANLPAMLRTIGADNIPRLQSAVLNDIFTKAHGLGETFTENGVAKMINKYGEDRLKLILTPEQFGLVKDVDTVVKAISQAEKTSKLSQTAFLGKTFGNLTLTSLAIKDLLTGNLMGAVSNLTPMIGEGAAHVFLNSNVGRKIITTGLELSKKVAPIIRQATKVGIMQATK